MAKWPSSLESMDMSAFCDFYRGRRVLVTGHTGFKGSWLMLWLQTLGAKVTGLALDPDTKPSHWDALQLKDVNDYRVDLRDAQAVHTVLQEQQPEIIFHLAAQPLVRRSYDMPIDTFSTNVMGLIHLLEAVRNCPSVRVVINATTDKVYAEQTCEEGYRENSPLGGHDPYSSSKACAELISECWRKSFFASAEPAVRLATVRAGNVIGGGDWATDRLVPDLVRASITGKVLMVRQPNAIRPWQHVLEPLSGYLRLGQLLWEDVNLVGAWNFGPGRVGEISVQQLSKNLAKHWGSIKIEHDGHPHPHEASVLRLNADAACTQLGWSSVWSIDESLKRTACWYKEFYENQKILSQQDLNAYIKTAKSLKMAWV
ncbi:CDP-glucose 4,6-dehydratase [Acinetobacter brisouii]|uniref:CDP-glucose 4,6-dehydratase n=1 Tax=Acinetobacter brisouii TaxID=396323 RepID=UPI0035B18E58